nr:hypothetical protein [Deltaproteobacteria bacterium]
MDTPTLETLAAHVADPNWVRVAGYGLEKIHTGVLVYALTRGTPASRDLAAALWMKATGEVLDPSNLEGLRAEPEVSLGKGADSVLDLLISFDALDGKRWLGIEMKVDASPRRDQLLRLRKGVFGRPDAGHAMVLLALGAAQVCRIEQGPAEGVARWDVDTLLDLAPVLRAAGASHLVEPWLRELGDERTRLALASQVTPGDARRYGYRPRTLLVYQFARFAKQLVEAGHKPWEVAVQSHNVVATASGSWRATRVADAQVDYFLELTGEDLCLKAGCWSRKVDPRASAATVAAGAFAALQAAGLAPVKTPARTGASTTLLKVRLPQNEPVRLARITEATETWSAFWTAHTSSASSAAT